jgi:hypothetical protein
MCITVGPLINVATASVSGRGRNHIPPQILNNPPSIRSFWSEPLFNWRLYRHYSTSHLASILFGRSLSSIGGSTVVIIITSSCHCHPQYSSHKSQIAVLSHPLILQDPENNNNTSSTWHEVGASQVLLTTRMVFSSPSSKKKAQWCIAMARCRRGIPQKVWRSVDAQP